MVPPPSQPSGDRVDPVPSTEDLLEQSRTGSRIAVEALLERHLPGLRAFVRLRLGPELRALESASDLVQSVVGDLLADLDGFEYRGEGQFRSWLYTVVLHKIRNKQRYHLARHRNTAPLPDDDALLVNSYAALCSPSHHAVQREQVALLERAFDRLPEHYREVLTLSRIVGLSQQETAATMGRTVASMRNLLHRALVQLAKEMAVVHRAGS